MKPARSRPVFRVTITDDKGRALRSGSVGNLADWLSRAKPPRTRGAVSIAIVPDPVMRRLNRTFRGKDRVTDVLSFPAERSLHPFLGDLAIARGLASRQAREQGHSLQTELRILALHGLLHLLGYDHETDRGEMRRLEDRLRRRAGLPSGLISRH